MTREPKTPPEKKRLSLERDRRNVYGENDKGSRKNIPRSKALSHRAVRRKSAELERTWDRLEPDEADVKELGAVTAREQKGRFRKEPDAALGLVIKRKLTRRKTCNDPK